ncbi:MAG TPA: hypothetical protein VEI97_06800, partial [bacterium]|nr:hypothetical protein [bacterium]
LDPAKAPPILLFEGTAPLNTTNNNVPHTARVRYYDPRRASSPLELTLDYVVMPFEGCTARTVSWNFNGSSQGWLSGAAAQLYNSDEEDKGGFTWACHSDPGAQAAVAASGGALGGEFLVSSPDQGTCTGFGDYGRAARYNIVSPVKVAPSLCGEVQQYLLRFNAFLRGRPSAVARAYISQDGGSRWDQVWSQVATGADQVFLNVSMPLVDVSSGTAVRVRFEFTDEAGTGFTSSSGYAGLMVDHVSIVADSGFSDWSEPTTATLWEDHFEFGDQGWIAGGDLPNFDGMGPCGPTWGGMGVCRTINDVPPVSGFAAVAGADATLCGINAHDFGSNADYNLVSPLIDLSGTQPGSTIVLYWDELKSVSRGEYRFRLYLSTDNGGSWVPLSTFTATSPTPTTVDSRFAVINSAGGEPDVRLRFRVTTPPPTDPPPPANPNFCTGPGATNWVESAGSPPVDPFAIDNVRIAYSK